MTERNGGASRAPSVKDDRINTPESLYPWLALIHSPGIGSRRIHQLLETYPNPGQLFETGHPDWKHLEARYKERLSQRDEARINQDLDWLQQAEDHHIIHLQDERYPALLKQIDDAPPVIYVKGNTDVLGHPQLAIIGSRNPTSGGRQLARQFAEFFGRSGLTVTSGMALGIDGAAHQGAIDACSPTIAVVGTGLDRVYPAKHRALAHSIAESGAILSEFPLGTAPMAGNFPRRNRIISGLSLGTLVVEAAIRSGSLITAQLALEQGREVFAIPGSIHNPLARGCHALIRQGAKLVESAEDVIEELEALYLANQTLPQQNTTSPSSLTDQREWDSDYLRLFEALGFDPISSDELIQRSGLTAEAVSSMLLLLELDGFVTSLPGGRFTRTGKKGGPQPNSQVT